MHPDCLDRAADVVRRRVVGKASTEPYLKSDPQAPQNRRISVLLPSLVTDEKDDD